MILYFKDMLNISIFININKTGNSQRNDENKKQYIFSNVVSLLHINIVLLMG